jgi:hypothetical protein
VGVPDRFARESPGINTRDKSERKSGEKMLEIAVPAPLEK